MFMHSWKYAWLVAPSPKKQTATRPWRLADIPAPSAAAIEPPTIP